MGTSELDSYQPPMGKERSTGPWWALIVCTPVVALILGWWTQFQLFSATTSSDQYGDAAAIYGFSAGVLAFAAIRTRILRLKPAAYVAFFLAGLLTILAVRALFAANAA